MVVSILGLLSIFTYFLRRVRRPAGTVEPFRIWQSSNLTRSQVNKMNAILLAGLGSIHAGVSDQPTSPWPGINSCIRILSLSSIFTAPLGICVFAAHDPLRRPDSTPAGPCKSPTSDRLELDGVLTAKLLTQLADLLIILSRPGQLPPLAILECEAQISHRIVGVHLDSFLVSFDGKGRIPDF